jgi:tetratricopeptide (TPR) repeat protein
MISSNLIVLAQTIQLADSLHQRGRELVNEGKIVEGRECTRQAMEIRKKLLGEVSEDYITSLNNYALTYGLEKDYQKAVELQEQVMALCGKLKQPHKNIGMYTTNMGRFYYLAGDKVKAAKMWEQALPQVEKHGEIYEFLLNSLGSVYDDAGDQQALNRIMALMEEHNQHELTKPCDEPKCMLERAQYYSSTGDNAKAKECYQKAIDMKPKGEMAITVYEAYAQFMAMTEHDRLTGAEYQSKAAMMRMELKGEDGNFARSLYNAGLYYSFDMSEGGFKKAIECYDQALITFGKLNDTLMIAKCQQMRGNAFGGLKDFAKAKECYAKALAYYEANDKASDEYPKMIERVAAMEKFNKEYDASIEHYRQAMQLFEERGMMQEYGNAENGLKLCYVYAGKSMNDATDCSNNDAVKEAEKKKLDQLIAEEKSNLELTRTYLGKLMYARSLATIAGCNTMKEDYAEALNYYQQYMRTVREAVREEFRLENETERMQTWSEEAGTIAELQELLVLLPDSLEQYRGDLASLMYDAELLSKGILLNSSIEFEKLLNDKNDSHLTEIYHKSKSNKSEINRLRREASSDEDMDKILELTQENQRLQTQLNKGLQEIDDFTHYISYDWKDVQDKLRNDDVSIEFTTINLDMGETPSHMVALVLTKDMEKPKAVVLWNEEDLLDCDDNELYGQLINASITGRSVKDVINEARSKLSCVTNDRFKSERSLYLDFLEHKADTTHGVFTPPFMPMMKYRDLLQQDSVMFTKTDVGEIVWGRLTSYLQDKKRIFFSADGIFNNIGIEYLPFNGKPLFEQFEVYRLSSTKVLCYKHERGKPTKAALFGDINYNEVVTKSVTTQRSLVSLRGSGDTDDFADLSNTRREVDNIQSVLKSKGITDAERFCDTEASKSAFMGLTDSKVNLLHIATHGMYKDVQKSTDAESMKNSLLAFAGANLDDNGLVTAADIATMNLRQCDLAVLSACETGLGKLGGDGVFGLQRGFKNAGVHTLLMSLKNVYDDSTADLMISFYKHLMDGSSKREALVKAQQDIRSKGFTDPKYWATFILLDAL